MRDAEGNLVRANTLASRTMHTPGASAAVLVKEIDMPGFRERRGGDPDKSRLEMKKTLSRRSSRVTTSSPSRPLLGNPYASDTESGISQSDIEEGLRKSPLANDGMSQPQLASKLSTLQLEMQYAQMPSLSSNSIVLPEERPMAEEIATTSNGSIVVSTSMEGGGVDVPVKKLSSCGLEQRSKLQIRPLPDDLSSEREKKLRPRQRKTRIRRTPGPSTASAAQSYGSIMDPREADNNIEECKTSRDDASIV